MNPRIRPTLLKADVEVEVQAELGYWSNADPTYPPSGKFPSISAGKYQILIDLSKMYKEDYLYVFVVVDIIFYSLSVIVSYLISVLYCPEYLVGDDNHIYHRF